MSPRFEAQYSSHAATPTASDHRPAAVGGFSGRGDLRGWLRGAATRELRPPPEDRAARGRQRAAAGAEAPRRQPRARAAHRRGL